MIKVLSFILILLHSGLSACSKMNDCIVCLNIDTNIGKTEDGYARESFSKWRVEARMPSIQENLAKIIKEKSPIAIQLQEGRSFVNSYGEHVDSITPLSDFLTSQGYTVLVSKYNPTDLAFSYITAIKNGIQVLGHYNFYFTKTPFSPTDHTNHKERLQEIKEHNFGEEWERSVFIVSIKDKEGETLNLINTHLNISLSHRLKACSMIADHVNGLDGKVLVTGDFNSFHDWGGDEQMGKFKDSLDEVEIMYKNSPIPGSFIFFPYDFGVLEKNMGAKFDELKKMSSDQRRLEIEDIYKNQCRAIGGYLDRVLQKNIEGATATLRLTATSEFVGDFNEDSIKEYVCQRLKEDRPAFASDHQMVVIEVK